MTSDDNLQFAEARPAFEKAVRLACYGHRTWLVWKDGSGWNVGRTTAANIKAGMLASGTRGAFTAVAGNSAAFLRLSWPVSVMWLKNAKAGYLNA